MAHAEICPVCKGTGKIEVDDSGKWTTAGTTPKRCHGCYGKGWVSVGTEYLNLKQKLEEK